VKAMKPREEGGVVDGRLNVFGDHLPSVAFTILTRVQAPRTSSALT
jgi:hypothetical protein